jgi:hypothetical protein
VVRTAAGLTAATFTDATLTARSSRIKAVHVTEMRTAVNQARVALGLPALSFTNTVASKTSTLKLIDFTELRTAVD